MPPSLEIIVPLRNPTEILLRTVASLIRQTNRSFSVLISHNSSTTGTGIISEAEALFKSEDIPVRVVCGPEELGTVEQWNWAHYEAAGAWLKPLCAGDWLEPGYVANLRAAISTQPETRFAAANYTLHQDQRVLPVPSVLESRSYSASELHVRALGNGLAFGPPVALAYLRDAFIAVGGFRTSLPSCAFDLLAATLSGTFGAMYSREHLCHCLVNRGEGARAESITATWLLAYHAWTDNVQISRLALARRLGREMWHHCFDKSPTA